MKAIFWPAVYLMLRQSNEKKLPVMSFIFFLPLALLYYETGAQLSPLMKACVGGGVLLGIYVMMPALERAKRALAATRRLLAELS